MSANVAYFYLFLITRYESVQETTLSTVKMMLKEKKINNAVLATLSTLVHGFPMAICVA